MPLYFNVFLKLIATAGETATVANTDCSDGSSTPFPATLTLGVNAFCGAGPDHTEVTYTGGNNEDRIREIVGTHCAGSCTQRVSPIRKPVISAVNNILNYRAWVEK